MKRNDTHFRQMLTPLQRDLLAEYERCTQRTVTLDYLRLAALAQLSIRDVTVDDMFTVIRYVKRRIRAGDNKRKVGTFTPASLEFGNLVGDYAKFEDQLQTAREELASRRIVKGKLVSVTRPASATDTITRLEPEPERAPQPMRDALRAALGNLMDGLA
jgi:hypothetical protein